MKKPVAVLAVALLAVLAACSSSNDKKENMTERDLYMQAQKYL